MKKKLVAFAVTAAMLVTSAVPAFAEWGPANNQTMPESNAVLIGHNAVDGKDYLKDGISQTGTAIKHGDTYSVTVDFLRTSGNFQYVINMSGNQDAELTKTFVINAGADKMAFANRGAGVVDHETISVPDAITTLTWRFDTEGDPDQHYLYLEVDNLGIKDNNADPYVYTIPIDDEIENVDSVVFEGYGSKDVTGAGNYTYVYKTAPSKVTDVELVKANWDSTDGWKVSKDKYKKDIVVDQPFIGTNADGTVDGYKVKSITFDDGTVITDGVNGTVEDYVDLAWTYVDRNGKKHELTTFDGLYAYNTEAQKGCKVTLTVSGNKTSGIFDSTTWGDDAGALAVADRIAGANRFETAMAIADEMKPVGGFTSYVVATGNVDQYADALSATAFAKAINAPILLVNAGTEDAVADYIEENAATYNVDVYVIGGTKAVSQAFVEKLYKLDVDVERLAGANRYETNLEVLKAYDEATDVDDSYFKNGMRNLLVATGTNYADALSASATGYPILLVGDRLTKDQREFLRDDLTDVWASGKTKYAVSNIYVLGGTSAVNGNILNELAGKSYIADAKKVVRIGGADRYATNRNIVEKLVPNYKDAAYVFVATGNDYADALAGGVLAAKEGAPLVLVNDGNYSAAKRIVKAVDPAYGMVVFGGENAVSNELVQKIA